jgi:hypothetical protein
VYLQGDNHLVSPCHYLDVRIKQKGSSGPLRLLLPQVRISLLLFCCEAVSIQEVTRVQGGEDDRALQSHATPQLHLRSSTRATINTVSCGITAHLSSRAPLTALW